MQVQSERGGTLLEVEVGLREAWKRLDHPLRLDTTLRLTCIPTLMHWKGHRCAQRLDTQLENAGDASTVEHLVNEFLAFCTAQ